MKKVVTILIMLFSILIFNSCTDETVELKDRIENEKQIELQLVDPSDDGTIDDEDIME